jgi:hypothetical protein
METPDDEFLLHTPEYKVTTLLSRRDEFLKAYNESWDIKTGYEMDEEPKEIDELATRIRTTIIDFQNCMDVDFMIESLARLGESPSILNDDAGNFSISGSIFQSISADVSDVSMSFFIEKKNWFKTIREALKHYLSE